MTCVEEIIDEPIIEKKKEEPVAPFVPPQNMKEFNEKLLKDFVDNPFAVINNIIDAKIDKDERFKQKIFDSVGIKQAEIARENKVKANQIYIKLSKELKDFDKYIPEIDKIKRTMTASELNILNKDPEGGMRMLHKMAVAMDMKKKAAGVNGVDSIPNAGGGKPKTREAELSDLEEKIRRKSGMTKEEYLKYKDKE